MRKFIGWSWQYIVTALLLTGIVCVFSDVPRAQMSLLLRDPLPVVASGCSAGTFGIDGTYNGAAPNGTNQSANSSSNTTLTLPTLVTSNCPDIIYVGTYNNGAAPDPSVTSPHLTFSARSHSNPSGQNFTLFSATTSSALTSEVITVTWGTSALVTAWVAAFTNIHLAAPFDANAPNSAAGQCSVTTANANDVLLVQSLETSDTANTGWTLINGNNFDVAAFKVATSTQTFTPVIAFTDGSTGNSICDAIIKGP